MAGGEGEPCTQFPHMEGARENLAHSFLIWQAAKENPAHSFRETVALGATKLSIAELEEVLGEE